MLSGETRLVGLLGNPVSHSLSPLMQNAAFAAVALDWAYVPLPVETHDLEAGLRGLVAFGFAGANVTIPHKTAVLPFCDEVEPFARRAASVNTLVIRDGHVHGSSTDGLAVTGAVDAAGARILLLGAGGAAQAVACALVEAGAAELMLAARRSEGSLRLAAHLHAAYPDADVRVLDAWPPDAGDATLVVNATPLREKPVVEPRAEQAVIDLAYAPDGRPTALVEAARRAGCASVVDGLEILVRQGAASFERWTGVPAPVEVMRAAFAGSA
jgi:shikimate dehydrogenase